MHMLRAVSGYSFYVYNLANRFIGFNESDSRGLLSLHQSNSHLLCRVSVWISNLVPKPTCLVPNFLIGVSLAFLLPKTWELLSTVPVLKHLNRLACRFLALVGTFSLEFYCVQENLCATLKPLLPSSLGAIQQNIVYFVSSLAADWLLYLLQSAIWKLVDRIFDKRVNPSQHG